MTISEYQWFNYKVASVETSLFSHWGRSSSAGSNYSVMGAVREFDLLFDKLCNVRLDRKHLVPISGGYDSRAILSALVCRVPIKNIETISFGFPGQLDYEVGALISEELGVKHHKLNLKDIKLDWPMLLETAQRSPTTFQLDALFNHLSRTLFTDKEYTIWSGFMGDPLAGSHIFSHSPPSFEQEFNSFVLRQKKVKYIDSEKPDTFNYFMKLKKIFSGNNFRPEDIINFSIRQSNCIAPIVLPLKKWESWGATVGNEINGAEVLAPFIDQNWAIYWLNAPIEKRIGQKLYLEMLERKFPFSMSLPSKKSLGLSLTAKKRIFIKYKYISIKAKVNRKVPMLKFTKDIRANYLDYSDMFRRRKDYQDVLKKAFDVLVVYEHFDRVYLHECYRKHIKGLSDYADYFCLLIGLAANIEAEKK